MVRFTSREASAFLLVASLGTRKADFAHSEFRRRERLMAVAVTVHLSAGHSTEIGGSRFNEEARTDQDQLAHLGLLGFAPADIADGVQSLFNCRRAGMVLYGAAGTNSR